MRRWILVIAIVAACGEGGEESESTARAEQCEQARSHLVDLRLAGSQALGARELQKHREALTQALGTRFIDDCTKSLHDHQVACLLAASDTDDINECHTGTSANERRQ